MTTKKFQKVPKEFYCEKCDYSTNKKSQYQRHLQTKKHNDYAMTTKKFQNQGYVCICGKKYTNRQNLHRHKKTSNCENMDSMTTKKFQKNVQKNVQKSESYISESSIIEQNKNLTEMFIKMVDSNKELQQIIYDQNEKLVELAKQPRTVTNIGKQQNFNLDNFLNIQCRDAMNLSDFVSSIELSFEDLMYLGNNGFIKSFENTFVRELKNLDQTLRPIHCTDKKRKTMYVKDQNRWIKDENNTMLEGAIDTMNKKQLQTFSMHSKQRPEDYLDSQTNVDNQSKIIIEMCKYNENSKETIHKKLLRDLSQTSTIDK